MRSPSRVRLAQLVGLALLAALAVLPVKSALNDTLGRDVGFLPAVAAVVVAAGFGGFLPGLVATGVSIVLEAYVFMDPTGRLDVAVESDRVRLLLFGLVGLLASTLAWLRDRAQEESHRARAEAESAKERTDLIVRRLSALQGLAAELAGAVTRDHITDALLTHGIASLQADGAVVFYIDPGGEHLDAIGSRGYSRAGEQAMSILPLDVRTPATDVARTGEPVFIEDPAEYEARYGASLASRGVAVQPRAVAAVPLAIEGRSFGVLGFTWDSRHDFAADRRTFIAAIASSGPPRSNGRGSQLGRSAMRPSWRRSSAPSARESSSSSRTAPCDPTTPRPPASWGAASRPSPICWGTFGMRAEKHRRSPHWALRNSSYAPGGIRSSRSSRIPLQGAAGNVPRRWWSSAGTRPHFARDRGSGRRSSACFRTSSGLR